MSVECDSDEATAGDLSGGDGCDDEGVVGGIREHWEGMKEGVSGQKPTGVGCCWRWERQASIQSCTIWRVDATCGPGSIVHSRPLPPFAKMPSSSWGRSLTTRTSKKSDRQLEKASSTRCFRSITAFMPPGRSPSEHMPRSVPISRCVGQLIVARNGE